MGTLVLFSVRGRRARAAEELPAKMELVDAAQLDAALAHIREAEMLARPHLETVNRICARYKIDAASLGRTISVDYASGAIARGGAVK